MAFYKNTGDTKQIKVPDKTNSSGVMWVVLEHNEVKDLPDEIAKLHGFEPAKTEDLKDDMDNQGQDVGADVLPAVKAKKVVAKKPVSRRKK